MKIALCCGDGLNYGKDWIGFDVVRTRFPGQLVLQDVRTLDGYRFRHAEGIFASPPCMNYTELACDHCDRKTELLFAYAYGSVGWYCLECLKK